MTVETARAQDDFAGFLKQRHRARALFLDLVELLDRRERALRLCERLDAEHLQSSQSSARTRRTDRHRPQCLCHRGPPHALARLNGRCRTDVPVSARHALATAGPIGGTPGSPTPVGFSAERITVTSTLGISWMRS